LRAVIVGPAGTPYHDGLFFFDFQFTDKYPNEPPKAYFHAHGRIFNPNLYPNGKVCLSLLNTWSGRENCEKWDPQRSTMLQVLVSIQGLVMNAQPYFNEPGFERTRCTPQGEKNSLEYNHAVFFASCDQMTYWLQKPPMHFEVFVAYHFYTHGLNMAKACEARSKECLQIYKVCFKKRADKVLKEYKAREVAYRKKFALKDKAGCTGGNDGTNSGVPNKANNKLKCFCYYLLKLGKKLLPMGN
ncbi:putative ubiquitin-conjugating enzyme E2 38, partial [Asparagus officinalis]|uniref:putative ubiquitin-conjugating enzyme E2 38 n=1 Tax=Asparagus officinalis TaxID=4686 RepID=UPI00098E190C